MSNDLISRKALLKQFDRVCVDGVMAHGANVNLEIEFVRAVQKAPSVDPHKHGRWIGNKNNPVDMVGDGFPARECYCSECGDWLSASDEYLVRGRYCPNCGAMMDGGEKQ